MRNSMQYAVMKAFVLTHVLGSSKVKTVLYTLGWNELSSSIPLFLSIFQFYSRARE